MRGAGSRVSGAIGVLALFYFVLLDHPPANGSLRPGSPALERTLIASRDAFAEHRFEDALEPTLALVEALPGQPMYLERLARTYHGLGRSDDEARTWEEFVEASAVPIEACPMLPESYQALGAESRALEAYERCLSFDPKNVDMLLFLGQAYFRAGRNAEARDLLERGVGYAPDYADYHLVLGVLDFSEARTGSARSRFEQFVAMSPKRRDEVAVWLRRTGSER